MNACTLKNLQIANYPCEGFKCKTTLFIYLSKVCVKVIKVILAQFGMKETKRFFRSYILYMTFYPLGISHLKNQLHTKIDLVILEWDIFMAFILLEICQSVFYRNQYKNT